MLPSSIPPHYYERQAQLILKNFERCFQRTWNDVCSNDPNIVEKVFFNAAILLSSDVQEDPLLNFANEAALKLWEIDWQTLCKTPGRKTAEPMEREARQAFLDAVRSQGYVENYSGIRISSTGKRFRIEKALVWNLLDENGAYLGQAATFSAWTPL